METDIEQEHSFSRQNGTRMLLVQLYGVCDLAASLGVHRNYITGCINVGLFMPTHQHGGRRYFSQERFDDIVQQYQGRLREIR